MLQPFEALKNALDLGLWFSRKFVVVDTESECEGEILSIAEDDGSYCPWFQNEKGEQKRMYWHQLAYAPQSDVSPEKHALREKYGGGGGGYKPLTGMEGECVHSDYMLGVNANATTPTQVRTEAPLSPPTEEYKPQVGDIVTLQGEVTSVWANGLGADVRIKGFPCDSLFTMERLSHATLISRKAKRRVTLEEVKAKFGEDVEIV